MLHETVPVWELALGNLCSWTMSLIFGSRVNYFSFSLRGETWFYDHLLLEDEQYEVPKVWETYSLSTACPVLLWLLHISLKRGVEHHSFFNSVDRVQHWELLELPSACLDELACSVVYKLVANKCFNQCSAIQKSTIHLHPTQGF